MKKGNVLGVSNREARNDDFYIERRLSKRTLSSWLIDIIKHRAVESLAVMRRKLVNLSRTAGLHSEKLFDSDPVRVRRMSA